MCNSMYHISYYILTYPFHFSHILGPGAQAQAPKRRQGAQPGPEAWVQGCKKNENGTVKYGKIR
jgi:hypothetical protein